MKREGIKQGIGIIEQGLTDETNRDKYGAGGNVGRGTQGKYGSPHDPIIYPNVSLIAQLTKTFNTMGSGGVWTGDLGVLCYHNNLIYMFLGDTDAPCTASDLIGNAIASASASEPSLSGSYLSWSVDSNNYPVEFFDTKTYSNVPGGAISISGNIYVFMMGIDWPEPQVTSGSLLKSTNSGNSFSTCWNGPTGSLSSSSPDIRLINVAPIVFGDTIYCAFTSQYRNSKIYMFRTTATTGGIETASNYEYFSGYVTGVATWSYDSSSAQPMFAYLYGQPYPHYAQKVGEIGFHYNDYLNSFILSYFDYTGMEFGVLSAMYMTTSSFPWGNYSQPHVAYIGPYNWYGYEEMQYNLDKFTDTIPLRKQIQWQTPYGAYILREGNPSSSATSKVWVNVSLWVPYAVFRVEIDLNDIFSLSNTTGNVSISHIGSMVAGMGGQIRPTVITASYTEAASCSMNIQRVPIPSYSGSSPWLDDPWVSMQQELVNSIASGIEPYYVIEVASNVKPSYTSSYILPEYLYPSTGYTFETFMSELISRISSSGTLKIIQAGNEPQSYSDVESYGWYLKKFYETVKLIDPTWNVVNGASGDNLRGEPFMEYVLRGLPQQYFDRLDFHNPGTAFGDYNNISTTINMIKSILEDRKWSFVSIDSTENSTFTADAWGLTYQTEEMQAADNFKRIVLCAANGCSIIMQAMGIKEWAFGPYWPINWSTFGVIFDGTGSDDRGNDVRKLGFYSYQISSEKLRGRTYQNFIRVPIRPVTSSHDYPGYMYRFLDSSSDKNVYALWWDGNSGSIQKTASVMLRSNCSMTDVITDYDGNRTTGSFTAGYNDIMLTSFHPLILEEV